MSKVGWLASLAHHRVVELAHARSRAASSNNRCVVLESRSLERNSPPCLTRFRAVIRDPRFPALSFKLEGRTLDFLLIQSRWTT